MSDTSFKFNFGDTAANEVTSKPVEVAQYSLMTAESNGYVRFKFVDLIDGTTFPDEVSNLELDWKTIAHATGTKDLQTNDWFVVIEVPRNEEFSTKFTFTNEDKSLKLEEKLPLLATEAGTVILKMLEG